MWYLLLTLTFASVSGYYSVNARDRMLNILLKTALNGTERSDFTKPYMQQRIIAVEDCNKPRKIGFRLNQPDLNYLETSVDRSDDLIAREHAKLVQDINSMVDKRSRLGGYHSTHVEYASEESNKDESIYMENVFPTMPPPINAVTKVTSVKIISSPVQTTPVKIINAIPVQNPVKLISSAQIQTPVKLIHPAPVQSAVALPLLLLGTPSVRPKPTLIAVTPMRPTLMKHPYPFVTVAAQPLVRPPRMPIMMPLPRQPGFWEKLIAFIPTLFSS